MPQISWYIEAPDNSSLRSPISERRVREKEIPERDPDPDQIRKTKHFRLLHSGEEFGISIDAYKV